MNLLQHVCCVNHPNAQPLTEAVLRVLVSHRCSTRLRNALDSQLTRCVGTTALYFADVVLQVLEPLRLACAQDAPKLALPALACLHKLVRQMPLHAAQWHACMQHRRMQLCDLVLCAIYMVSILS